MAALSESNDEVLANELANRPLTLVIVETGLLAVIALTSFVGNTCVLYVFYKTPRLRTEANFYAIVLACSNWFFSLVVSPPAIATSAFGIDIIGHAVGQGSGFFLTGTILSSLYITSLIAINRYFCVVKPYIYRRIFRRSKLVLLMIIGVWILSLVILTALHLSKLGEFKFFPGRLVYLLAFRNDIIERFSRAFFQVVFVFIPMIITTACLLRVSSAVRRWTVFVATTRSSEAALSRREVHVTKSLLVLVTGFIVCWIPTTTIFHIAVYIPLSRGVEMFSIFSVFVSTAINPVVLNIFNKPFRNRFVVLFWKRHEDEQTPVELFSYKQSVVLQVRQKLKVESLSLPRPSIS